MKIKIIILFLLFLSILTEHGIAGPRKDMIPGNPRTSVIKAQGTLNANNISTYVWNTGVFNQDLLHFDFPGFNWPKGQPTFAIFTTGLTLGAMYQGALRLATASYIGEYGPGYVNAGAFATDSRFHIYSVKQGDNATSNPDFANWGDMVPFGAPYVDVNHNGQYDPGIDIPGIKDAAQTIFVCMTDADPSNHSQSEGFSGGTLPLFAEVHLTAWAYTTPGLEDLQFIQWVVINRAPSAWNSTYFSIVVDPDLGFANDDYIGCDTTRNMGYVWNSSNQDGTGTGNSYGLDPPAAGMDFFLSPIIPTGNNADTVQYYYPPGSTNRIVKHGFRQLGSTSFDWFSNPSTGGIACEHDPSQPLQAYNYQKGLKNDGSQWINFLTGQPTKFCYTGDPETGVGWTELSGRYEGCGGVLGPPQTPCPPGDRRFIFNSGDDNFTVNPGDTQVIVLAQFIARGANNKNSVTQLKNLDNTAQQVFDLNFKVIPPPPPPVVKTSYRPNTTPGAVDITFSWGDTSESYYFNDELFHTGFYKFQGYEVYEIRKDLNTLPDFNDVLASRDGITLIGIYDYRDTIGLIQDSLPTGYSVNGVPQYVYAVVEPPYGFPIPAGFPNSGLSRHVTLTNTNYSSVNGGSNRFIKGNTYKFAIVAYGYNPNGLKGGKVIRNSLSTQLITLVPESPLLGTQYYFQNGDTLYTNRRDLGLMPIIENQEALQTAKYRVVFNDPDTTYGIYRSYDNGASFQNLKNNLKFTDYHPVADDSSRIIDGILFNVQKIRYINGAPIGNYTGNVGVIPDLTLTADSLQTRQKGWDYIPAADSFLTGSRYFPSGSGYPYQSVSMSISYPTKNTYIKIRSSIPPEQLRNVKIVFTGYGHGQQAYRYTVASSTSYMYQDMQEIPVQVFDIDPSDGTSGNRQLNCAFLDGNMDNKWSPSAINGADSTGGGEVLYIFNSNYSSNPDPFYTTKDLFLNQSQVDIMYVWAPRLIRAGATFHTNDQFIIYPYTVTRPTMAAGYPLYYEFTTQQPVVGSTQIASQSNGLQNIKVVPNPYYGYNSLESSTSGRFVTFRNLPKQCTIKIFTLNGDMIKKIEKNDNNSTINWTLANQDDIPIASGIYIALVDAPGIGTRSIKLAVFTPEERIDF